MCVYVCVYVCMYVHVCVRNVYVCMYVCMYVYAKVNFHFVKAQSKLACIAQSELARIAKVNYFFFLFTFCFFFFTLLIIQSVLNAPQSNSLRILIAMYANAVQQ